LPATNLYLFLKSLLNWDMKPGIGCANIFRNCVVKLLSNRARIEPYGTVAADALRLVSETGIALY
jgi:hypothetical protein